MLAAPRVFGQAPAPGQPPGAEGRLQAFRIGGPYIGATVRELEASEAKNGAGVYVESVQPDSPASRAGLQAADIVTRFDGETVRSVRQFTRLVQETPSGRSVTATVRRDGRQMDMSIVPEQRPFMSSDRLRQRLDEARARIDRIPFDLDFDFDFDFDGPRTIGRSRLGVSIEELTPQLAAYFGAKNGVLVASVADNTPASRAGLRAGDVIVSVNSQTVAASRDLVRALRDAGLDAEVTIGIVRDKKETSVKARLEAGTRRQPRIVRPVSATPA
jgi:serine protease Do